MVYFAIGVAFPMLLELCVVRLQFVALVSPFQSLVTLPLTGPQCRVFSKWRHPTNFVTHFALMWCLLWQLSYSDHANKIRNISFSPSVAEPPTSRLIENPDIVTDEIPGFFLLQNVVSSLCALKILFLARGAKSLDNA